jgi:hypothetical protein
MINMFLFFAIFLHWIDQDFKHKAHLNDFIIGKFWGVPNVVRLQFYHRNLNDIDHNWQPWSFTSHCIGGVMVSVFSSSVIGSGFEPKSGQAKDYRIGICCFSAKHATLRKKIKDWLAWNQDNVSEWGDMSIYRLLFQWASNIKIQLTLLVYYKADLIIISLKIDIS